MRYRRGLWKRRRLNTEETSQDNEEPSTSKQSMSRLQTNTENEEISNDQSANATKKVTNYLDILSINTTEGDLMQTSDEKDDCILIEQPSAPVIVINEDDSDAEQGHTANERSENNISGRGLITSTPFHKVRKPSCDVEAVEPYFCEDKSRLNWYERNALRRPLATQCSDDDSVIFVSETKKLYNSRNLSSRDFIPLQRTKKPVSQRNISKKLLRKHKGKRNPVCNEPLAECTNLNADVNQPTGVPDARSVTHNHKATVTVETANAKKRQIIIDGSNVAFSHGRSEFFSVKGISIAIDHFENIGHKVTAVVPQYRSHYNQSSDPELLKILHRSGRLAFAPCKNLPNCKGASYDDRFIVELAVRLDAAIVSNDNYRDLLNEGPEFKEVIESRVMTYMWCDDVFVLAKDPYGRAGPFIEQILNH